jgi:hypothetical protein
VGSATGLAVVIFLLSIIALAVLLAGYSVSKAKGSGGRTYVEIKTAGLVLKFGTEINGSSSHGDRSAEQHSELTQLKTESDAVSKTEPSPAELPPGRRHRRPRTRAPDGG